VKRRKGFCNQEQSKLLVGWIENVTSDQLFRANDPVEVKRNGRIIKQLTSDCRGGPTTALSAADEHTACTLYSLCGDDEEAPMYRCIMGYLWKPLSQAAARKSEPALNTPLVFNSEVLHSLYAVIYSPHSYCNDERTVKCDDQKQNQKTITIFHSNFGFLR